VPAVKDMTSFFMIEIVRFSLIDFVQFGDRFCSIIDSGAARKVRMGFLGSPVLA
jgi:hypothetical protein